MTAQIIEMPKAEPTFTKFIHYETPCPVVSLAAYRRRQEVDWRCRMKQPRAVKEARRRGPQKETHSMGTVVRVKVTGDLMTKRLRRHDGHLCEVVDFQLKVWDAAPNDPRAKRRYFYKYTLWDLNEKDDRRKIFRCEDGAGVKLTAAKRSRKEGR